MIAPVHPQLSRLIVAAHTTCHFLEFEVTIPPGENFGLTDRCRSREIAAAR